MNKVILDDFMTEFYKNYDKKTFNGIEVINNYTLDQSSIFIRQDKLAEVGMSRVYSISPINQQTVNMILSAAANELPINGYYIRNNKTNFSSSYVTLAGQK